MQLPPQARLQQTPSAHWPLAHPAAPPLQLWPFLSLQAPSALQIFGPLQVSSSAPATAAHAPGCAVVLQASQVPHAAVRQQTLSTQWPVPHSPSRAQGEPLVFRVVHPAAPQ
jgi:hypothetical protein